MSNGLNNIRVSYNVDGKSSSVTIKGSAYNKFAEIIGGERVANKYIQDYLIGKKDNLKALGGASRVALSAIIEYLNDDNGPSFEELNAEVNKRIQFFLIKANSITIRWSLYVTLEKVVGKEEAYDFCKRIAIEGAEKKPAGGISNYVFDRVFSYLYD